VPPPALPRSRLGRAATFAFRASVVGAAALVSCGEEGDDGNAVPVYGSPPTVTYGGAPAFGGANATAGQDGDDGGSVGGGLGGGEGLAGQAVGGVPNSGGGETGAGAGGLAEGGSGGVPN